jgi:maleylpyruvate isomerase
VTADDRIPDLVAAVRRRTDEVVAALRDLGDDGLLAPSALPGWSRLTIACHLRYGAEAFGRMTVAALEGRPVSYYPGGREAERPGTLEPAPGESPADVVASLAAHGDALDRVWSGLAPADWARDVVEPAGRPDLGTLPLGRLPLQRLTEVEVHGTDLDLGLTDWSEVFVHTALPFRLGWLPTRRTNHRRVDDAVEGSWLLSATDGPAWRLTVAEGRVTSEAVAPGTSAQAVLEAPSRDLLALLLGRPLRSPAHWSGDTELGQAFVRAFPGP